MKQKIWSQQCLQAPDRFETLQEKAVTSRDPPRVRGIAFPESALTLERNEQGPIGLVLSAPCAHH